MGTFFVKEIFNRMQSVKEQPYYLPLQTVCNKFDFYIILPYIRWLNSLKMKKGTKSFLKPILDARDPLGMSKFLAV